MWAESNELFHNYHDKEWGVPVHDDRLLFEMLNLEGAQAGLSWLTILKKRRGYRLAFENFNIKKVAAFPAARKAKLLKYDGIVKNKLKIKAVVENAKAALRVQEEFGSFDDYIWSFVDGQTLPANSGSKAVRISRIMSKDLSKRGFRFVGPTICYAFMQAVGMINDHSPACFRRNEIRKAAARAEDEPGVFTKRVIELAKKIPYGRVATFGQLASLAGGKHSARVVVWILNSCSKKYGLPWHRVINSKGEIGFSPESSNFALQKSRLRSEGVDFSSHTGLDLKTYQWKK